MVNQSSVETIANIYQSVVEVDPAKNLLKVHKESDILVECNLDNSSAKNYVASLIEKYFAETYRSQLQNYLNIDILLATYEYKKYSEMEFKTINADWCRVSIFPAQVDEEGKVVTLFICLQNITSVKATEEKHNEMISAMSHIYDAIFFVDIDKDLLGVVNTSKGYFQPRGRINKASDVLKEIVNNSVDKDYITEMNSFFSLDTLARRLADKNVVSNEYLGKNKHWYWGQFICALRENGKPQSVLLGIRDVTQDRKRSDTKDNVIRALSANYKNIFIVSFATGKVDILRLDEAFADNNEHILSIEGYDSIIPYYIDTAVHNEDKGLLRVFGSVKLVKEGLCNKLNSKVTYRIKDKNNRTHYIEARFEISNENDDCFILATKNIDDEVALQNEVKRGYDAYYTLHKLIKSGMWSCFYDDEGKLTKVIWSDEFRRMVGYSNEEDFPNEVGNFVSILHEEDSARVIKAIQDSVYDLSGSTQFDEVFRIHTNNRGIRWFRATGDCSRNAEGLPYSFYGVFLDINAEHEREKLEQERIAALEEAKAYQEAMNFIHGAMNSGKWVMNFDEKGNYKSITWDDDFWRMLGYYGKEDFPDDIESYKKLIHPDDVEQVHDYFVKTVLGRNNNEVITFDYRIRNRSGEYVWFQTIAKPVVEGGKNQSVYGLLMNVDDKKKNEARLAEQYRIVDALSHDYTEIHLLDLKEDKAVIIKRAGVMADIDHPDIRKYSVEWNNMITHYADPSDAYDISEALSSQRVLDELRYKEEYAYNFKISYRGEHYYQVKYIKLGETDQNKTFIVSGIRSIDAIIASEREQKILLKNALASAERANRAKTVFLNSMSHDIRTPMNAIVGFATLATTHIDNQNQVKDYLDKIKVSSNHLLSLINDVLDMSRIESGKVKIDAKQVHLPDALHDIRSIIQSDITAKRLELQIDCMDVVNEDIICDKLRLNQVLLNLVSNSIKFTPAGGIISIKVIQKTSLVTGRANFEFVVQDTGIGMSKEFIEHIFEPFSREETSTVSGIQGTGLGMAITKNIIDMMHGTINVESEPNQGTKFTIELSFDVSEDAVSTEPIKELENVRALVADDDMDSCFNVAKMLSQLGLRSEWTTSGKEAVARTNFAINENDQYGVYVFDWLIPDMNGLEIVRRIRKDIKEDAKIIILSSYDWTDIESEARELGVTAFCSKPLFMSELREILTDSSKAKESDLDIEGNNFEGRRILVVEDNELNREIAEGILETVGFITETASDGNIAVDMVSNAEPGYYDVILMDIQMPTMNGYEATKLIRKLDNEALRNIPIIAMTANAFEEDKKKAMNCGMNGHVAKPFETKMLFKTIGEFLK